MSSYTDQTNFCAKLAPLYEPALVKLYGNDPNTLQASKERYQDLCQGYTATFDLANLQNDSFYFFSTPGRSEIMGNHTDHQHGRVICSAISLDIIALVKPISEPVIRLKSKDYNKVDEIDLNDLNVHADEIGHSAALIRGVCAKLKELGYKVGGFECYTSANVPSGSGLSSSAAFEVMIISIIDKLYNNNVINPLLRAQIAQYAENVYFDKPCGLMDQCGCSFGGMIKIDFANSKDVNVEQFKNPFANSDYHLVISKAGGSHADLTNDYADIPAEMRSVSHCFGKNVLREVAEADFWRRLSQLRNQVNDRALLRSIHFFSEQERVEHAGQCLAKNDIAEFLKLVQASGQSSWQLLQNIYSNQNPLEQPISIALAVSAHILNGQGAYRVHGGGFAGTIQAYVPANLLAEYKQTIDAVCGANSVLDLQIRPYGAVCLEDII